MIHPTLANAALAAATAGALCCTALLPGGLEAQQALTMNSDGGASLAYSVPLDIRQTESWKLSRGEVDWQQLIRPIGTVTNRGRTAVKLHRLRR
jgi:hypothetical protein